MSSWSLLATTGKQVLGPSLPQRLTADDAASLEIGEYEVPAQRGRDTCIDGIALCARRAAASPRVPPGRQGSSLAGRRSSPCMQRSTEGRAWHAGSTRGGDG